MRTRSFTTMLGAAALAGAGCGGGGEKADTSAAPPPAKTTPSATTGLPAPDAKVTVTQPQTGSTTSVPVVARVDLQGFELSEATVGKAAKQGQGHLHFQLDGGKYDYARYSGPNGELAEKLGVQGKYSPSVTPTVTYTNIPAGEHTLKVFVANNDHEDTGVVAETTFTVQ